MINYYLLSKPGIIMGNLFTVAAGFILGTKDHFNFWLFAMTLLGLTFIMISACVFNNYIDQDIDKKMERTKSRPLVSGAISPQQALIFGTLSGLFGCWILYAFTNYLALGVAIAGFIIYVLLYSLWKCRTVYGTAIGSLAGATPPVVGYCAASGQFDYAAMILFAMLVLWQMPHFYAIALFHLDDYKRASIPVMPLSKGIFKTKIHMIVYILAFILAASMLTLFNYMGFFYMIATLSLGVVWVVLAIQGFSSENDTLWGKQMFRFSLVLIGALCLIIPFDKQL